MRERARRVIKPAEEVRSSEEVRAVKCDGLDFILCLQVKRQAQVCVHDRWLGTHSFIIGWIDLSSVMFFFCEINFI